MKNYVVNIMNYYGNFAGIWYGTMMEDLDTLIISDEGIVVWDLVPNYSFCNFMPSCSECQENELFYYHPDHLGSTGMITDNNGIITKGYLYAPFGEIINEYGGLNNNIPKYAFNAKELDEENGMYYYSARYYAPPTFISRDPMFEKYPSISPYTYCANNPMNAIDPTGKDVEISGEAKKEFVSEVKKGAKELGISVKMDKNGMLSAKYKGKGAISEDGKKFMDAVNDKTIHVKVNAVNHKEGTETDYMYGGTFGGNEIQGESVDGAFVVQSVIANQKVIPSELKAMDDFYGKPGMTSIHEITEAFFGGKIAIREGVSSVGSGETSYAFREAHSSAVPQSGKISIGAYDANDNPLPRSQWNNAKWLDWNVGVGTPREKNLKTTKVY